MAAPLIVRLVMDAAGYLKTVDTAVASNTKLEQSALGVGEAVQVSANKSVQASLKATEALKAQIAGYRELAVSAQESADVRARAALLATRAENRLNAQMGLAAVATAEASTAVKTGERDLGKFTRGALAGSGAASSLGRSLAFASTGFIAIAGTSTLIASSIRAALDLAKTQRQVDAQLKTTGKSWQVYGTQIDSADLKLSHISGFTNQELLQGFGYLVRVNGNVSESLKLVAVAADVARGRGISLASASIALAKAQGGSLTALRRLGIVIPANVKGMDALAFVAQKFAGQAKAGATVSDRFHASLVNTEEIIGTALLPTFTRLTTEIGDWLARMNESGRLQRDVNDVVTTGGVVFHTLGAAIKFVDKITGGFSNTLKILFGVWLGRELTKAIVGVGNLAKSWTAVETAAAAATVAQEGSVVAGEASASRIILPAGVAAGEGAAAGAAAAGAGFSAGAIAAPITIVAYGAFLLSQDHSKNWKLPNGGMLTQDSSGQFYLERGGRAVGVSRQEAGRLIAIAEEAAAGSYGATLGTPPLPTPGLSRFGGPVSGGPPPPAQFTTFTNTLANQIAQARAALTKSTADDVAAAKAELRFIRREIAAGHFNTDKGLLSALLAEAQAQAVLDSARQQAAQKAAQIAAAKLAVASSYTTPIDLQIAEARAQLTQASADDLRVEKQILAAAKAALNSGKKNKQGQLAALQVMLQAQQAIQSLTSQSDTTFTLPLKLQLALAKAQALGTDQTKILLKMKAALERALKAAKGNIQKQIDIYNQIASINQQLNSSTTSAYGDFKKASVKAETSGLGLTAAQRRALQQRLSQRGPGGTVPATGTGVDGYIIGPDGRPINIHQHRRPHYGRSGGSGGSAAPPPKFEATFNIRVYLDGKDVTKVVTVHQQHHRKRNPSSRRGPHAGTPTS